MEYVDINNTLAEVENHTAELELIVNNIIHPYCAELDECVNRVSNTIKLSDPTDEQLERMCMSLSTSIYYASSCVEKLGIRDDISKSMYKEVFNRARDEIKGTIADKNAYAELNAQKESITNDCYARAYKILKAKVDNAQELLASCKKVLSRRIQVMQVTKLDNN